MSAVLTLAAAHTAGIVVTVVNNSLELEANDKPPEALLEALGRDKSEIIKLLRRGNDGWNGEDWLAFFDERAGLLEFDGGISRADAERHAFDHCVNQWLVQNPLSVPPDYLCLRCDAPTNVTDRALALSDGERNAWIHAKCQEPFLRERCAQAVEALAQFGIPPAARPEGSEIHSSDTIVPFV